MEQTPGQAPRDIFAITGLPPEVLAVAMAKYSRSKESIRTTIDELTEEKSADFHEKWVLGYGDASVADMAVISIACENVSILASKAVEDCRLASYQEKSTRYVDFGASSYHRPPSVMATHGELYVKTVDDLFATYFALTDKLAAYLKTRFAKPDDVTEKAYEAKLKARSLDAARYLLPTATLTNFGMIMNARGLRHCISKLLANPYEEIRHIGEEIRRAALEPAYNPQTKKLEEPMKKLREVLGGRGEEEMQEVEKLAALSVKGAPTLIKRTDPSEYIMKSNEYLTSLVAKHFGNTKASEAPRVDYIAAHAPEDELVATLLYSASSLPYRQILQKVQTMSAEEKASIIDGISALRGQYDQPRREYEVSGQFIFDVLMDYGAFRDLQRHRICTQINQPLTIEHGYETPFELIDAKLTEEFDAAIARFRAAYDTIRKETNDADYLIPLAYKKRTLFKMDLRELYHMVELRSKPGGHMSYRTVVLDMYEAIKKAHPALVKDLRAVTPNYDQDFFKR